MTLSCPKCGKPVTLEHLRTNPECAKAAGHISGLYQLSQRKTVTRAGGRPTTLVPCHRCGEMVSPTKAKRGHGCVRVAAPPTEGDVVVIGPDNKPLEACGVKGPNKERWRMRFETVAALNAWLEENDADCVWTSE